MEIKQLTSTNVYSFEGRVLVCGACLGEVWPEALRELAADADGVYALCLEVTHINMAVTKILAMLSTGRVTHLTFASVDRSPHCTQMHYIRHEIERSVPRHVPIEDIVISAAGEAVRVPAEAIELSKTLSKLARMAEKE